MRVLVVEDEDAIAEPLAEGLRREGFDVTRVATGEAALAQAADAELVLLDVRLPDVEDLHDLRVLQRSGDPRLAHEHPHELRGVEHVLVHQLERDRLDEAAWSVETRTERGSLVRLAAKDRIACLPSAA